MSGTTQAAEQLPMFAFPPHYPRIKLRFLAQLANERGPVLRSEQGAIYMIGPEANRFVMQSHRAHFSHEQGWTPQIGELFGRGLLNMDPPEHDRHRKMMNPAFTIAYMERYLAVMNRVIAERSREWIARDEVDLYAEARKITFDVAAETLVGFRAGPEVDALRELFYTLLYMDFDAARESEEQFWAKARDVRDTLRARLLRMIADRRGIPESNRNDILSMMVNARDDDGNELSDDQILAHVNILLVAGHETSTTLSAWLLYLLATNPDELAKVRAELDDVLGRDGAVTLEAIKALRYLGYAVQEAGRFAPPVALVPRGVLSDVEFGGYLLPAGAYVLLAIGASHWDPQYFAEPERFDPSRFAPPREEDKRTPYALATFGGGPRICIGINFAQVEIKAMAAHILRDYTLEPIPGREPVQQYEGIIGAPEHGIVMRVRPRR